MRGLLLLFILFTSGTALAASVPDEGLGIGSLGWYAAQDGDSLMNSRQSLLVSESIESYENALSRGAVADSTWVYQQLAFAYAQQGDAGQAADRIRHYLHREFRPEVLSNLYFDPVRESAQFKEVLAVYAPRNNILSYIYLYVGLIGFYIAFVLFLHKRIDQTARLLIGAFVLIHSVFILNIYLSFTNYSFLYPHSLLMSTGFSFLYGPLLYFYFKRVTKGYEFRPRDVIHLVPTLLIILYLIPIYAMPAASKLELMLAELQPSADGIMEWEYIIIVALKLSSLIFYGWLIRREFMSSDTRAYHTAPSPNWMRNVYLIHVAYIVCYSIYGGLIIYQTNPGGGLYHAQVVSMSLMVLYVGYFASLQPQVFGSSFPFERQLFTKYRKSGLTTSLSRELRDRLVQLFDQDKIFRENDLNLEGLATRMDTTRHNASQVINEHFRLSFHELVNKYRIEEAKAMLERDAKRNLNIIDIAYEVGYNNKVTFNKAFKKDTQLTPSQYQQQVLQLHVNKA